MVVVELTAVGDRAAGSGGRAARAVFERTGLGDDSAIMIDLAGGGVDHLGGDRPLPVWIVVPLVV